MLFPQRPFMDANSEQSYEEGFTLPLRHGHGNIHLKALHIEATKGKAGYDLSAFKQVMEQAKDALAIVSYAGAPTGFETLFAGQPKPAPFYVFDPDGTTNWLAALKAGLIRAVVLPRPGAGSSDREAVTGMPQAIFERFYLLVTPETVDPEHGSCGEQFDPFGDWRLIPFGEPEPSAEGRPSSESVLCRSLYCRCFPPT